MTQFSPEPLSDETTAYLNGLQDDVNAEPDRAQQYDRAKNLWNGKSTSGNESFWKEIKQNLGDGHPSKGICQYCEHDRLSPIEHYYPKKHFPNRAFNYDNYLLICFFCNTICKGDKFAVFNPDGSDTVVELPITRGAYPAPPTDDAVLLNPRTDDPAQYMMLEFATGMWMPATGLSARAQKRFEYTRNLLRLNTNDALLRARRKACSNYLLKLKEYKTAHAANDFDELLAAFAPDRAAMVRTGEPFRTEKNRVLETLKADILDDPFPSVWREIKAQRHITHINNLFTAVPDALNW